MTASSHELDRVVLEAVSDDYQSFESLVSKLSRSNSAFGKIVDLESALLSSIANKLVAAYLLHAESPYATEVGANSENIRRYWFSITEEGRKYLASLARKQTVPRRRSLL